MAIYSKRDKVKSILRLLPLLLKRDGFAGIFNRAKALYTHHLKNSLPEIDGISRDEMIMSLSTVFKDRFIAQKLVPIYLFYDEPIICLQWLKGNLKGVSRLHSDLMKEGMLQALHKFNLAEFKDVETDSYNGEIGFIINELQTFDYDSTDSTALDVNMSWVKFFDTLPRFASVVTAQPFDDLLRDVYEKLSIGFIASDDELIKSVESEWPAIFYSIVPEEIYYHQPVFEEVEILTETDLKNPEHTLARKVLAIYYLLEYMHVKQIDNTVKRDFIHFLTGLNKKNIYDAIRNPLATDNGKYRTKDLHFIRPYFEKLQLTKIVKLIDDDLERLED